MPDDNTLDLTQFTLALAVKPTASHPDAVPCCANGTSNRHGQLSACPESAPTSASFVTPRRCGSSDVNGCRPSGSALNRWSHITASYDGSTKKLYLNGTLVASKPSAASPAKTMIRSTSEPGRATVPCRPSPDSWTKSKSTPVRLTPTPFSSAMPHLCSDCRSARQHHLGQRRSLLFRRGLPVGRPADGATFAQVDHLDCHCTRPVRRCLHFCHLDQAQSRGHHPFDAKAADRPTANGPMPTIRASSAIGMPGTANTIYPSLYVGSNGRLRMIWGDGANTCEVSTVNETGVVTLGRLAASHRQLRRLEPDFLRER